MKKLLIGLLALGSISSFAADVCTLTSTRHQIWIACSDVHNGKPITTGKEITVILKEKIEVGYEVTSQIAINGMISYTLIKN